MPGLWKSLVESKDVARVTVGFENAIAASFDHDQLQAVIAIHRVTQAEIKRRFGICAKVFEVLRGDLKWSIPRTLDHIPIYLRNELDGDPWEPSARSSWGQTVHSGETKS